MIKLENWEVVGWEHAIRGMRNPKNSWGQSDSECLFHMLPNWREGEDPELDKKYNDLLDHGINLKIGPNDQRLMEILRNAGTDHRKFIRYIDVYVDITAPFYWWKEFKTYRRGRKFMDDDEDILEPFIETNSCSTMHKIHEKEFTLDDFSCEHLSCIDIGGGVGSPHQMFKNTIRILNECRELFLKTKDKEYWWQMIQLLPSSYNQKRTVKLNYEVLIRMYHSRKNHKLDEWRDFCAWIESLPYSEIITGGKDDD